MITHASSVNITQKQGYMNISLAISLFLYAFFCPLSISATYFPLYASLIPAILIWLQSDRKGFFAVEMRRLFMLLLVLVSWQIVITFLQTNEFHLSLFTRYLNFLPVFVLSALPCNEKWKNNTAQTALLILLSVTAVVVTLGIYQYLTGTLYVFPLQPFPHDRLIGFFKHHIPAGGFFSILTVLSFVLILFWKTSARMKIALCVLFFILLVGTLLSLSRTYFVSLLLIIPLILVKKSYRVFITGMLAVLLFISTTMFLFPTIRDRAYSVFDLRNNPSNLERIYLWKVARDIIVDHPLTGIGFKQWKKKLPEYSAKYSREWTFTAASFYHAHNAYLHVAVETGLVGLFFFLLFWLYLLYLTFHTAFLYPEGSFVRALNLGTSYALINLLIGGLFDENFGVHPIILMKVFIISLSFFVTNYKEILRTDNNKKTSLMKKTTTHAGVMQIKSRSLPITNKKVIDILSSHNLWYGKILDLGAGSGYLSSLIATELSNRGFISMEKHLSACDLFPSEFKFDKIKCIYCNFNSQFPYEDNTFKAVCSIEVIEHIENIFHYAREVYRILEHRGIAIITTPNILNINSRIRFFITGFPLLFNPLPISSNNPKELGGHINPISCYFLTYAFKKAGFQSIKIHTDRFKNSAKILITIFYFPIKIFGNLFFNKFKIDCRNIYKENCNDITNINSLPILLSRTVIIEAIK